MQPDDKVSLEMTVRDALRIYIVIGRATGHSDSVYSDLAKVLGLSNWSQLGDGIVNEARLALGRINYHSIQYKIENAYFNKAPLLNELNSKRDQLEILQAEIQALTKQLVSQ